MRTRLLTPTLLVVLIVATTHVAATQLTLASLTLHPKPSSALLLYLAATSQLLLPLALPLMPPRLGRPPQLQAWLAAPKALALATLPLGALWLGANGLFVTALDLVGSGSLVLAVFASTPALVAVLAVPVLGRRLSLLSLVAVALSAVGVALVSAPWSAATHADGREGEERRHVSVGIACVLGAAACAAAYKVLFRRIFGDAPTVLLFVVLGLIGAYALVLGPVISLVAGQEWTAALWSMAAPGLGLLAVRVAVDLSFNLSIAVGLALTHPLYISVGTLLSTPLNLMYEMLSGRSTGLSASSLVGAATICLAFLCVTKDDARRENEEEKRGCPARRRGGHAGAGVQILESNGVLPAV